MKSHSHLTIKRNVSIDHTPGRHSGLMACLVAISLVCSSSSFAQQSWWTLPDADFANKFVPQATGTSISDQSAVAWMIFARVNQPQPFNGGSYSQWELWPSNDDTFSAAMGRFVLAKKIRTRPHLQEPKSARLAAQIKGVHGPDFAAGEEVTRNMISYSYITAKTNGLDTQSGVKALLSAPNAKVDLPIGAVEVKAVWGKGPTAGAYQITDSTPAVPVVYSLLGLHIMAKVLPRPDDAFYSETPSWFWTTFEFKDNPGLAKAQSLLTYKDALDPQQSMDLLKQAGLSETAFANYRCNGTQIRYSDDKNPNILMGNTTMETFAFVPKNATSPAQWTQWNVSCHSCHGTASASVTQTPFFFPFGINHVGVLKPGEMDGYQSLDFIWSIPFHAK